jgi:hypothetical protein
MVSLSKLKISVGHVNPAFNFMGTYGGKVFFINFQVSMDIQ